MKTTVHYHDFGRARFRATQGGASLFFALIGLVVLLLAAAVLVRTVDTASIVAGNLSFKQAATTAGDRGVNDAVSWLAAQAGTDNSNAASGYYASVGTLDFANEDTWAAGASGSSGTDDAGNTVRYVIERMCRTPNQAPNTTDCLYGEGSSQTGSKGGYAYPEAKGDTVMYRVTIRVVGPRNTVSYAQAVVY